jgi:hypothetical protein
VDAAFASGALAPYRKIAVAGFAEGRAAGAESDIRRLAGLSLNDGPVETGAGETVAESIHIQMAHAGFALVERGKVLEAAIGEDIRRENGWAMAMAIAQATGADVVAMGCVARFEDRVGTWYSADKPASVAFGVVIVDPAAKKIVWAGKFEKRQQSLLADLTQWRIFYQGGLSWQTADALAGVGAAFLVERMRGK